MNQGNQVQLSQILDHSSSEGVLAEVEKIFCFSYVKDSFLPVTRVFDLIQKLFHGNFPGYKACNTEYHNLGHTMDAFVATARLIDGRNTATQAISTESAVSLLIAALLHDTGYIQEEGDTGTGAKYTQSHVERSVSFLKKNALAFNLPPDQIELIGLFIACTGLKVRCDSLCFESEDQVTCGAILGTADLLGQMADRSYLEKLLFLYYEFKEAGMQGYETEFDILKNTLNFYQTTRERLDDTLMRVYVYAEEHFATRLGIRSNLYIAAIERQMDYLRTIISDDSTNFRQKLKRIDLEKVAPTFQGRRLIGMWAPSVPYWELIIRSVVVYGFLLVLLRITGKRQVGQLAPFDLVLLLVLSNSVQNSMNAGDNSLIGGLISATALVGLNYVVSLATYRSKKLEEIVEGRPQLLIHNGKLFQDVMERQKLTHHELNSALREAGCDSVDDVHSAVLENNGVISVVPRAGRHIE